MGTTFPNEHAASHLPNTLEYALSAPFRQGHGQRFIRETRLILSRIVVGLVLVRE